MSAARIGAGTLAMNGSVQTIALSSGTRGELWLSNNGTNPMFLSTDDEAPAVAPPTGARLAPGATAVIDAGFAIKIIGTAGDVASFSEV